MDMKTLWNLKVELLERAFRLREFNREWLKNTQLLGVVPNSDNDT
jgi:hypothetical protein